MKSSITAWFEGRTSGFRVIRHPPICSSFIRRHGLKLCCQLPTVSLLGPFTLYSYCSVVTRVQNVLLFPPILNTKKQQSSHISPITGAFIALVRTRSYTPHHPSPITPNLARFATPSRPLPNLCSSAEAPRTEVHLPTKQYLPLPPLHTSYLDIPSLPHSPSPRHNPRGTGQNCTPPLDVLKPKHKPDPLSTYKDPSLPQSLAAPRPTSLRSTV